MYKVIVFVFAGIASGIYSICSLLHTVTITHLADKKKLVIILESNVHLQKVSDMENFGQHLQLICVVLIQLIQLHVGKLVQTTSTYG